MPPGFEYFGTHQMPFTEASAATRRSTSSMSGPSSVMGTGIISMPNSSVIAEVAVVAGSGAEPLHRRAAGPTARSPACRTSRQRATASYMSVRLALPSTMTFSGSSSSMQAMNRFASGRPSSTP